MHRLTVLSCMLLHIDEDIYFHNNDEDVAAWNVFVLGAITFGRSRWRGRRGQTSRQRECRLEEN